MSWEDAAITKLDFISSAGAKRRSRPIQHPAQPSLHIRPLRRHDRKACRIASDEISGHPMRAENPFKLPANAFDRRPRTLVARIRMQADPEHLPAFKSMRQHQQLGLAVSRRPDRRPRQPRVANFAGIGDIPPVPRMAQRPSPSLHVEKPCRPNHHTIRYPDSGKRHRRAGVSPSQSGLDVAGGVSLVLRNRTPPVEGSVNCRSSDEAVSVAVVKRFETNVLARQQKVFRSHSSQYAMSQASAATKLAPTYCCCCCCSCSMRELTRASTGRDWITMLGDGSSGSGASDGLTVTATLSSLLASPLCTPRVGGTSA